MVIFCLLGFVEVTAAVVLGVVEVTAAGVLGVVVLVLVLKTSSGFLKGVLRAALNRGFFSPRMLLIF